jgi:hypothetical protein
VICRSCQDYVFDLQRVCRCDTVVMAVARVQENAINSCVERAQNDSLSDSAAREAPSTGIRIQDGRFQNRRLCRRRKRHDISASQRERNHGPQRKSVVRY